jgi:hypothetical protein
MGTDKRMGQEIPGRMSVVFVFRDCGKPQNGMFSDLKNNL